MYSACGAGVYRCQRLPHSASVYIYNDTNNHTIQQRFRCFSDYYDYITHNDHKHRGNNHTTHDNPQKKSQSASPAPVTPSTTPTNKTKVRQANKDEVARIQHPYDVPPTSADILNVSVRNALVNIVCIQNGLNLSSISGSGVIVDPQGVILTNAHVAQYVLLSGEPDLHISCVIRTGSPARVMWHASVLYMPTTWVHAHAQDIRQRDPVSTGENDYALLFIDDSLTGAPLPKAFPSITPDVREAIGFVADQVLAAGYPAGFLGLLEAQNDLGALSTITTIKQLYSFNADYHADAFSLGGIILAQNGSSGGAVINMWGKLVGLIVTTSSGTTTSERDLRALSTAHIDRSLRTETGTGLLETISSDAALKTYEFTHAKAPTLIQEFLEVILNTH